MYKSSSLTSSDYSKDFPSNSQIATSSLFETPLESKLLPNIYQRSSSPRQSLVFVDTAIASYQDLISSVTPGTEIILLDPSQDGIVQITNALAQKHGVASLQILSHGSSGGLQLGQTYYNLSSLEQRANNLASWANALTDDADILLYGCNIASDDTGIQFVNYLSQITGADIAASNDLTGNAALGGDWDLEVSTGAIETNSTFIYSTLNAYNGVLDAYLSDLTPASATNAWGPVERDQSNGEAGAGDGRTLTLNGVTYAKGLGVHAASDITYTLGGAYTRFTSSIGVDDEVGSNGSVVFQVWADGIQLFASSTMSGSTATQLVDVDLTGRQSLRLVVTGGSDGIAYDHANWANAQLITGTPTPDTTAPTATATAVNITTSGTSTYDFTVTYIDNQSVNITTLDGSDVRVSGPNSFSQLASLVSVSPAGNGTPRTATYRITAPGGVWHPADNGAYTIALQASQVTDLSGNAVAAGTLGTFQVNVSNTTSTYLSDLTPASATNAWGPVERDQSNGEAGAGDGRTLTLNGVTYAKGLGVHAASDITYTLGGAYTRFTSSIGVDDEVGSNGSVVFQVWADGIQLFASSTMSGSTATQLVDVDLTGRQSLRLVVTGGSDGIAYDHANWANAQLITGTPTPDTTAPTATATAVNITTSGTSTYDFTVTYIDNQSVNITTLDGSDVRVSGPNSFSQLASLVSVSPAGNGTPRTATYRITAPGGVWHPADNGAYTIALQASQVTDLSGNAVAAGTLGTFQVNVTPPAPDTSPPTATLTAATLDTSRTTPYTFTVNYADATAVNVSTINSADIRITGPNGFSQLAQLVSVTPNTNGTPLAGTYQITAPDGIWNWNDRGTYTATLLAGEVRDTLNNTTTANTALGTFQVAVQSTIVVGVNSSQVTEGGIVTIPIRRTGDTTGSATINYFTGGNSTATPDIHYVPIPVTTLTFAPGEAEKNVVVQTLNDGVSGTSRTVSVLIESPTGADLGPSRTSSISIVDQAAASTTYLSDLNWASATNAWGPVERDRSNGDAGTGDGRTLTLDGTTYRKGLGVHSASEINYTLGSSYNRFVSYIGVDDEVGNNGSVVFQIWADGIQLYDSGLMTGSSATKFINVDVTGRQNFRLVVTDGSNGVAYDHADWADAQLVIGNFTPPPPPPPPAPLPTVSFTREQVIGGLIQPTTFAWSPNGNLMFIAEKGGVVRVSNDVGVLLNTTPPLPPGSRGLQSTPFIDISSQVNNVADRGLLGLAVDPFFGQNQGRDYVYLLFTYDPPETQGQSGLAGPDQAGNRPARLIRVTANPATNYTTAIPNSEVILLGKNSLWQYTSRPDTDSTDNFSTLPSGIVNGSTITAPAALIEDADASNIGRDYAATDTNFDRNNNIRDYLAGDSQSHTIGQVHFGLDGALYVTVGDGTSYNGVDPRAIRAQDVDNLSGKLLRINPLTGQGLADNPFYNGDLDSNRSKVWSYGLRNSFRFTVQPKTGNLYLGEVGWNNWEELNVATRGANLGWPYFEGIPPNAGYSVLPQAQAFYNSGQAVVNPLLTRNHAANANSDGRATTALIMGDFYSGNTFPAAYNGALFYNDVGLGYVYTTFLNSDGTVNSTQVFDNLPYIVDMETGPDGNLYYASLYGGEIGRWKPA